MASLLCVLLVPLALSLVAGSGWPPALAGGVMPGGHARAHERGPHVDSNSRAAADRRRAFRVRPARPPPAGVALRCDYEERRSGELAELACRPASSAGMEFSSSAYEAVRRRLHARLAEHPTHSGEA